MHDQGGIDMLRILKARSAFLLSFLLLFTFSVEAQKNASRRSPQAVGTPILWRSVNVSDSDLFNGSGGEQMKPDLSRITFIKRETGGHNKKYRIKDGSGRVWVAKLGSEARPETAAVRLLSGIGYETEINYLVPQLTIPGVGSFTNVRLEARPDNVKRLDEWHWRDNPFVGTNELQGLKIMQVFLTNYDLLDLQNKILKVDGPSGPELHYIISDLGATFGRYGYTNIPLFYRIGRADDNPKAWSKAKFIKGVKNGRIIFATTGSKSRGLFKDITVAQGRWLYQLLRQLNANQIQDAFRAANYSPADIELLTAATQRRITELERATSDRIAANK
jgi:hypothetical protein